MKKMTIVLLHIILSAAVYPQDLFIAKGGSVERKSKTISIDKKTASLKYAWELYRSEDKANYPKADAVLNYCISLQDNEVESMTYGQWGWKWQGDEKVADLNRALFQADIMFDKLWEHQNKMSPETKTNFIASCERLLEAAKRRWDTEIFDITRDFTAYSNIFVMYIETLTLAGDRFNNPRLKKIAKSQWTRWYNHISYLGIDEFASPTYNHVVFSALMNIHNFCHDERIQKEVKEVMDHIYLLQSAITHPLLKLPVTGISRDYRNFLIQPDARSAVIASTVPEGYTPPPKAVALNQNRTYPFEVIGKASIMPFIFKSYQLKNAAMGSMTGGHCFQQQIHCMAAVGHNENERAVAFVQGSNTPINGFTDQIETSTLCIFNRLSNYWNLTQKHLDITKYREVIGEFGIGISPNWNEKLKTPEHIVLEAFGYNMHIFPFAIQNEKIEACDLILKHRTTTSPRYHPRNRIFDEYVFPPEPDWFGAYIALVRSGSKVDVPNLEYTNTDGIRLFKTNIGHQVRLHVTEKDETKQLFNIDPALIPLFKINESCE